MALAFNTLILTGPFMCDAAANSLVTLENIIIFKTGTTDSIVGAACAMRSNIVLPQMTTLPRANVVADPLFTDRMNKDFTVLPSSLDTDHDLLRQPRPKGDAKDIGAYEQ